MQSIVPDPICWRPEKQGFPTPEAEWCRGPLKPLIQEVFNSASLARRGWLGQICINDLYEQFQQSKSLIASSTIWRWLDIEIWAQIFLGES
jgi:asparagine synthase (glutamine-hydrolysing)